MAAQPPPTEPVSFKRLRNDNSCVFALDGRIIELPHRETLQWLAALADEELGRIVPAMLKKRDLTWVFTQLADSRSPFDMPLLRHIARTVVREVTGLPWWAAVRLANAAGRSWFLADATVLMRGPDLLEMPIRRSLSIVYLIAAEGCENDRDRAILDNDIFRAPEGEDNSWSAQQQATSMAAFRAMRSQFRQLPTG